MVPPPRTVSHQGWGNGRNLSRVKNGQWRPGPTQPRPQCRGFSLFIPLAFCRVQISMPRIYRRNPSPLEFLNAAAQFLRVRRAPMLGMALLIGFAFVCLVIVYDRLTNRL
jgi:hypothetical protein